MNANNIQDIFPLSGMQQLLLMHGLHPGRADQGFLHYRCTLRGSLHAEQLRNAWSMVVERSDILRTSFAWDGLDEPLQVVHRAVTLPWRIEDWSDLGAEQQSARFEDLVADDRARGFDLNSFPLTRLTLVRMAEDRHVMLWSHHHLQTDGWSVAIIIREVFACYVALCQGREPALEPRRPFRDYIAWLRERDQAAAEAYWRRLLRGFTVPTQLAGGPPAPSTASAAASASQQLPASVLTALEALAKARQVTLNTLVQAAWAVVVSRIGGEADVVFGTAVSGRPPGLVGVEHMIGTFVNNLPTRVQVKPEMPLAEWLKGIFDQQIESQEFDYAPLSRIEEWSDISGRDRLFESLVLFDNTPDTGAVDCGEELHIDGTAGSLTSNYQFTLGVQCRDLIKLRATWASARLSGDEAERILAHFAAVLARMAEPAAMVSDLILAMGGVDIVRRDQPSSVTAMAAKVGETSPDPYLSLHHQLIEIWQGVLGRKDISISDDFFALGGHSLLAARMFSRIQQVLGCKLSITALFAGPTIEQLTRVLMRHIGEETRPVVELTPANGQPPLFYLHGDLLGGGYYTVALARGLGKRVPFYVMPPIVAKPKADSPSIEAMALEHIHHLRSFAPHGPYRLCGFCNGGVVMFEVARQLRAAGEKITFLGLIEADAPSPLLRRSRILASWLNAVLRRDHDGELRLFGRIHSLLMRWRDIKTLPWQQQFAAFFAKITRKRRSSSAPSASTDGHGSTSSFVDMISMLWSIAGYNPGPYLDTVHLFVVDPAAKYRTDPACGWAEHSSGIVIHKMSGRHLEIVTRQVGVLAAEINQCLDPAVEGGV